MSNQRIDRLHTAINHMSAVVRLIESGRIGHADATWSLAIPARRYLRAVYGGTTLSATLKFLWHVLRDDAGGEDCDIVEPFSDLL